MRRLFLTGLIVSVGCQGVVGPAQRRCIRDPIDNPWLTPDEQNERLRERAALPEGSNAYGPRTFAENPALKGASQGSN